MEGKLSRVARTLEPSPIQELSLLAHRCGAINLAEGFPDFPAPPPIKEAAVAAIHADLNQYSLRHMQQQYLQVSINQGDEVLLFDPAYETYESCIALAGGIPVYVALDPPCWTLDVDKFMKSFTNRTKAVVLNSPHNPTGKVFSQEELEAIAGACCKMDCIAITDEVYEYITFGMQKHTSLASLPGMQERTIITSSLSKTFSITGWRIGWACAPAYFASAIRNIHIKLTDSAPAPFQEAALTALSSPPAYFESLKTNYEAKRDYVVSMLSGLGFQIHFKPQGSTFVLAELPESWFLSDVDFVRELIQEAGVAAVPGCGFFHTGPKGQNYHSRYVRFAFCKSHATLSAAAQKMQEFIAARVT